MKFLYLLFLLAGNSLAEERPIKVVEMKMYQNPASWCLRIPFNGCVVTDPPLNFQRGEFWFNVDHLTKSKFFKDIEVLTQYDGLILGGRAAFNGTREEWEKGEKGIDARLEAIEPFVGGDSDWKAIMKEPFQIYNEWGDFGGMVYSFDSKGVTWRKLRGSEGTRELHEKLEAEHRALHLREDQERESRDKDFWKTFKNGPK